MNKTAVITFGRAAIPTKGHQVLFDAVNTIAKKEHGTPMIFLSHTFDKKKNPVDYDTKVNYLTKCGIKGIIKSSEIKTIFDVLNKLEAEKYAKVVFVVGSDRVESIRKAVLPYLGSGGTNNLSFAFDVVSAGERDPDSDESVAGISGTKMRQFVVDNDFASFQKWAAGPVKIEDIKIIWNAARHTMGL
jgi:hypothetical protein